MNSIALFLWTIAASAQIGANPAPAGVKYGWKHEDDGSMSYIGQVTPAIAHEMESRGEEIAIDIPDFLRGRVNRVVWRIGTLDVEREPTEAELRATPPRQVLPNSGQNPNAQGNLTSLGDRSTGQVMMIDPQRAGSMTLPTAGTGRANDSDPSLPPVPSLAQTYPSPSTRSSLNSQFDMPRSNPTGSNSFGLGTTPVLPRQDTLPSTSGGFIGPQLPPGYTTGQVTVTGSPSGTGGTNAWNDSRFGSNPSSFGTSNPISNGNFGNPNNYGPSSGSGSQFSSPSNSGYSVPNSSGFASPTSSSNAYLPSNANTQFSGTNPQSYSGTNQRPDAYLANNPGYSPNPYGAASVPPPYSPGSTTAPLGSNGYVPGTNYTAMPASQSYAVTLLLLVSFVGNVYLIMLLNQLWHRYRALQASSRGATSLAI